MKPVAYVMLAMFWAWAPAVCAADDLYRWLQVPIEVTGLPPAAAAVPVSCAIDCSACLQRLGIDGAVDERALDLQRVVDGGRTVSQPLQFRPDEQPAAKVRHLLSGNTAKVSVTSEFAATETPPVAQTGTLTWIAQADAQGRASYRLRLGVPRRGRLIQVPYPPRNLRAFDLDNLATTPRWFATMQIRPQRPLEGTVQLWDGRNLITAYHTGPSVEQPIWKKPCCGGRFAIQ